MLQKTSRRYSALPSDVKGTTTLKPDTVSLSSMYIGRVIAISLFHFGAVVALFFFTWQGLVTFLVLSFITGQLGISLGFHRLLAHRSFSAVPVIKYLFAFCGTIALQAGPMTWVAIHRRHHRVTDQAGDPHTPRFSFIWAHFVWTLFPVTGLSVSDRRILVSDLSKDVVITFLERHNWSICGLCMLSVAAAGWIQGGPVVGLSCFLWGGCFRTVFVWHQTFLVNSLGHTFGYRNYNTRDASCNSVLLSILVPGDGWHNNHHAYPGVAKHGHRRCEFDPVYLILVALERLGLVTCVCRLPHVRKPNEAEQPFSNYS
jgi:fatty-acid desaturase